MMSYYHVMIKLLVPHTPFSSRPVEVEVEVEGVVELW